MGMLRFLKDKIMLDRLAKGIERCSGGRRFNYKEVIPRCGIQRRLHSCFAISTQWRQIENKRCRTEPDEEDFIKIVKAIPGHAQKFPISGMNGKEPKC